MKTSSSAVAETARMLLTRYRQVVILSMFQANITIIHGSIMLCSCYCGCVLSMIT